MVVRAIQYVRPFANWNTLLTQKLLRKNNNFPKQMNTDTCKIYTNFLFWGKADEKSNNKKTTWIHIESGAVVACVYVGGGGGGRGSALFYILRHKGEIAVFWPNLKLYGMFSWNPIGGYVLSKEWVSYR